MPATAAKSVATTLRKQFPAEQIGKLPRVTCPDCSDRRKQCNEHSRARCDICKSYISEKHIHLDYVGHSDVTARLLEADEEWGWEPRAVDVDPVVLAAVVATGDADLVRMVLASAPPKFDLDRDGNPVGLWIKLTVGGVTRLGYGSCPGTQPDAVKVLIGDALRNSAMRFGVALDLWAKGDRADPTAENPEGGGGQADRGGRQGQQAPQRSPARGRAVRPAEPDPAQVDEDAQILANEAANATTVDGLKAVYEKGKAKGKLNAQVIGADAVQSTFSDYVTRRKAQLLETAPAGKAA